MYYYICKPDGSIYYSDAVISYMREDKGQYYASRYCDGVDTIKTIPTSYNLAKTRKISTGWYLFDIFKGSNTRRRRWNFLYK